ncbi:MAG TPA: formyltransferase [Synergistaceae bacterium]|nr:formyltransferase [Synergistaceae bacterium]HPJ26141.1 formyltransferase [Synergistaceae bacterium]
MGCKKSPRVVLCAYSEVGAVCLETLLRLKANVAGVFTYKDNPEENVWFRSVEKIAAKARIPIYTPEGFETPEERERLLALRPDLLLSCYYRHLLPKILLEAPSLGAYNMHGSLLPRYRGRACINWAILKGETEAGVTLHVMTEAPDKGDIVGQEKVPLPRYYTALDLSMDCAAAAGRLLRRSWKPLLSGNPPRIPQDQSRASYFGGRKPEDGRIHWKASAEEIYNLVRGVTRPWPGAFTTWKGKKLFLWWGYPRPEKTSASPGEILSLNPLEIATGEGIFVAETLQMEGGPERTAISWGEGERIAPGQKLGE